MRSLIVVLALLGTVVAGGCGDEPSGTDAPRLARMRDLLTEATSCPVSFVAALLSLGDAATIADAETSPQGAGAALLLLAKQGVDENDIKLLTPTLADALWAMVPGDERDLEKVPADAVVSLLRTEFIHEVDYYAKETEASGVVTFRAGEAYEGRIAFKAERGDGTWAITELALEKSQIRVELSPDGWKLHRPSE